MQLRSEAIYYLNDKTPSKVTFAIHFHNKESHHSFIIAKKSSERNKKWDNSSQSHCFLVYLRII